MNTVPENNSLLKFLEQNYSLENLDSSILNEIDAFVFIVDVELMRPVWLNNYFYKRMHYEPEDLKTLTTEKFFSTFHEKSLELFRQRIAHMDDERVMGKRSIYQILTKKNEWMDGEFEELNYG